MKKKILHGLTIGTVSAAIALLLWYSGTLDGFEGSTWDLRARMFSRPGVGSADIVVVLLDQKSLDWGKEANGLSWPWPREIYGYLLHFLNRGNPKSIAFDVLYTEPSGYGVYDDEAFASEIKKSGRFIGTVFLSSESGKNIDWPKEAPSLDLRGPSVPRNSGSSYSQVTFPIPEIISSAKALANVHSLPDKDGIFRRGKLFYTAGGRIVPSMALASYIVGEGSPAVIGTSRRKITINGNRVPVDKNGSAILNYRGRTGAYTTFNAAEIIRSEIALLSGKEPDINPSILNGKYVFFGFSAPGLMDLRATPVDEAAPGVEVHAAMLDNLISGDFKIEFSPESVLCVVLFFGILSSLSILLGSKIGTNSAAFLFFVILPPLFGWALYRPGFWFPVVVTEIAVIIALTSSEVLKYSTEGQQKRFIKSAFRQYLSPAVIEQIIEHPENLKLGGQRRKLTMFFSDLQGFTSISESLSPEELTSLLNDYLSAMTEIIQDEGGTVDKYEGDAIIAFWNAPLPLFDHALRGVRASLRCQEELARLRPEFQQRTGKGLYMRIGLNTGDAVVGNMGSHTRFDYTMMGDAVNLASRLEGANKQFGTYTMISGKTYNLVKGDIPARELARIAVVGRKEPVTVYEPMLETEFSSRKEELAVFEEALSAFYTGSFDIALPLFSSIKDKDPAAYSYTEKCTLFFKEKPSNWNGVWVISEK